MVTKISLILSVAFLAVVDAASNRTLIIISLIGSGTTLFVGVLSALVSVHNSREARTIREKLVPLAELPQKVDEFRKEVDGRMKDLTVSRQETSDAKQELARAEGAAQERTEERDRVASSVTIPAEKPVQKVEMVNDEANPANVRAVKSKI